MNEDDVLLRIRGLTTERLRMSVTEAWVRPHSDGAGPVFDETDVARLSLIVDLMEDMAVTDDAVPLILGLLDEVSTLRRRIRALDRAIADLGPTTTEAVIARIVARRDGSGG